jgi:hypothetical protein
MKPKLLKISGIVDAVVYIKFMKEFLIYASLPLELQIFRSLSEKRYSDFRSQNKNFPKSK